MSRVSTYLNFSNQTEAAFEFYRSVFGGNYLGGIMRFGDIPASGQGPQIREEDKNLIMHIELPILGGHILMGSDAPGSLGFTVSNGNSVHIMLEPDTRLESDRIFSALAAGGTITAPLQVTFWGGYYGTCIDKFSVQWMLNCSEKAAES